MLIIPAILESFRSLKDRTMKLTFETSELKPQDMAEVQAGLMRAGYLAFNEDTFTSEQLDFIRNTKVDIEDSTKTPAQRLKGAIYVYWKKQKDAGMDVPDSDTTYYQDTMNRIIRHYGNKIEELD